MKRTILFSLAVIFLLSGCSPEQRLERKEDRLIGAWTFEKAFYNEDGALFRDNVIRDFEGDIIEFLPDFSCIYDDYSLRYAFWGDWIMHFDRGYYDDEPDIDFFLDMTFFDNGRVAFSYFSSVTLLTNNRLNLRVHDRRGVYIFKLRRI
jgi:hypothetical protein